MSITIHSLLPVLSFGLWLAVPFTGYLIYYRFNMGQYFGELPKVSVIAFLVVVGILTWSIILLFLVLLGIYNGWSTGLCGWIVGLIGFVIFLRKHDYLKEINVKFSLVDLALVLCLLVIVFLYIGFPNESLLYDSDPSVYSSHAIWIANHSKLDVPYPWTSEVDTIFAGSIKDFSGLYYTQGTLTVQFAHLFAVWLAHAYNTFGYIGVLGLNGFFGVLCFCIFFGVVRLISSSWMALFAALFLAFNPSQIWLSRITLTEIMAQLFIWSAILSYILAIQNNNRLLSALSGFLFGFSAFVRVDSFLLIPILIISYIYIVTIQPELKISVLWKTFFQTSLPVFGITVLYYFSFSRPYFIDVLPQLRMVSIFTLLSLFLVVSLKKNWQSYIRKFLISKIFLISLGGILIILSLYAYYVRPNISDYSSVNWIGHPLHGTRDYREYSLLNLGKYLSPLLIWGAIVGVLVYIFYHVRNKQHTILFLPFFISLCYASLYIWNPSITPYHFWAIRRFVPVVIPGFVFLFAYGFYHIISSAHKYFATIMAIVVGISLIIFTFASDSVMITFAENQGAYKQLEQLSEKIPSDEYVLAYDATLSISWITPIYMVFDKKIIPINMRSPEILNDIAELFSRAKSKNKSVYIISEGSPYIKMLNTEKIDNISISHTYIQPTLKPIPNIIAEESSEIGVLKVLGFKTNYNNFNMGAELVPGVEESGFRRQEFYGDVPFRWTDGNAVLTIPIDSLHRPNAVEFALSSTGPNGTHLKIFANDIALFDSLVPPGGWEKVLMLTNVKYDEWLTINIKSDVFSPAEVDPKDLDIRKLGVAVRSIELLENYKKLSGSSLPISAYQSQLTLNEKLPNIYRSQPIPFKITISNRSKITWPSPTDIDNYKGSVRLGILWFKDGDLSNPVLSQRFDFSNRLNPKDSVQIEGQLDALGSGGKKLPHGNYEVWFGLLQENVAWFYQFGDTLIKQNVYIHP